MSIELEIERTCPEGHEVHVAKSIEAVEAFLSDCKDEAERVQLLSIMLSTVRIGLTEIVGVENAGRIILANLSALSQQSFIDDGEVHQVKH